MAGRAWLHDALEIPDLSVGEWAGSPWERCACVGQAGSQSGAWGVTSSARITFTPSAIPGAAWLSISSIWITSPKAALGSRASSPSRSLGPTPTRTLPRQGGGEVFEGEVPGIPPPVSP
jgi:hypothetical protein